MSPDPDPFPPIVCAVDERYCGPLCVLLQSIADVHGPASGLRVIVLHRTLGAQWRERILSHAERVGLRVELCRVADPPDGRPLTGWVNEPAYLRLSMPEVVSAPVALYLDVDMLVLDDLRPLLRTPLEGDPLAAVRDAVNPVLGAGPALRDWARLGLAASREYFNSGVMLLDLAACRDLFAGAERFLRERPEHVRLWDQDALNFVTADRWRRLDRRWNAFAMAPWTSSEDWVYGGEAVLPLATLLEDERSPAILHFAGADKPWHAMYPAGPGRDRYRRAVARMEEEEAGDERSR